MACDTHQPNASRNQCCLSLDIQCIVFNCRLDVDQCFTRSLNTFPDLFLFHLDFPQQIVRKLLTILMGFQGIFNEFKGMTVSPDRFWLTLIGQGIVADFSWFGSEPNKSPLQQPSEFLETKLESLLDLFCHHFFSGKYKVQAIPDVFCLE